MPVYTAELYPTSIRNVGVGACNVAAGLALILTPYLDILVSCRSTVSGCRFLLTNPFMWRGKLSTSTVSLDRWKSRSTYSWPCWQPGVYSAVSSWFSCPSTTTARRRRPPRGAGSRTWRTGECNEGWSGDFMIQVNIIELTCWNLCKQKLGSIAVGIEERRLLLMMIPKTTRTQWHFQVNWQGRLLLLMMLVHDIHGTKL